MGERTYRRQQWEEWYQNARAYADTFGNLLVPHDYVTADGYRLGRWIERQRAMHNGVIPSSLDRERCLALERIGMVWKLEKRLSWETWMAMVQEYHQEYGDLDVPTDYTAKNGCQLGYWIKEQRKKYKGGYLAEKQIRDLERFDMIWSFYERKDWEDWLRLAEMYYQTHGNLLVPASYQTADGDRLGSWIFVQRERYWGANGRRPLSREQVKALEQISMVWGLDRVREEKWNAMVRWIEEYKNQYGCLPLRPSMKAPDGRSMGNWISLQRTALTRGKVAEDRKMRLEGLGIYPFGSTKTPL
ncbi:helicase associated domain-containing protein [Lactonifactor longoviformis]|uniref:helicase associated domain-containing protein n=1 Tax=Lactonifactor longoviformis TaxID=341220 RepID=UPI0036F2F30A